MKTTNVTLRKKILFVTIITFIFLSLVLFLPARTFRYWEAWIYMGIIFSCASGVVLYFLKHDPELLERRIRTREKVKEQKWIITISWVLFLPIFILPGFDKYYNWSDVPISMVVIADIFVLAGYLIIIRVFRVNTFTSRIIEVDSGQKVISTGPYSIIRHPMYAGSLLMYGFTPIALGSWWALTGSVFLIILIIFRLLNEEKFLIENLEGYLDYMQKTKYRLIPGIW